MSERLKVRRVLFGKCQAYCYNQSLSHCLLCTAMERVSENMHVVANEPSLALYRLQEHVRKALPFMVEKRGEFVQLHEQLQGRTYDTDYAVRYT